MANSLIKPITDLNELDAEIQVLAQAQAEDIMKTAFLKVSKALLFSNITFYVQAIDPIYKKYIPADLHMCTIAHTFGGSRIFIAIDPTTSY